MSIIFFIGCATTKSMTLPGMVLPNCSEAELSPSFNNLPAFSKIYDSAIFQYTVLQNSSIFIYYNIIEMSVAETIAETAERIQHGNAADLRQGLATMAALSKQQLTANQSSITYPLQMLTQAVDRNLKANQTQITPDMGIRKLLKDTEKILPDKVKREMTPAIKQLEKQTGDAQRQGERERRKQEAEILDTKRQLQKQMKKDNLTLKLDKVPKIYAPNQLSALQQEISQYQPILSASVPQVTTVQNLPPTMQLLARYAQLQGLKGTGSVSNKGGMSYVGIKEIEDESLGIKTFVPYQLDNEVKKKSIPSISMQLQYYANKTMNSWNRYVDAQSQFVSFIGKVNTPTNRQMYLQKQFKTLNLATFYAQMIATVSYYYLYLPLLKMAATLNTDPSASSTLESFYNRYQVGTSRQLNPLLLMRGSAVLVAKYLFQTKKMGPVEFGKGLGELIQSKIKNSLNKEEAIKIINYPDDKKSQAKQFLNNNGIQASLIQQVLAAKDWSSVKKKRVIAGKGTMNPYIAQMARKIVKQDSTDLTKIKDVQFTWSQEQILAHDYIWGHSSKY